MNNQALENKCQSISVGIVIRPASYYTLDSDGIRAFRNKNIGDGKIVDEDWVYITPEGHAANKKSALQKGDVLVARSGNPGIACVVTEEYANTNCVDTLIIRPDKNVLDANFLSYFINSELGKKQIVKMQGGLALKHCNVGEIRKLVVPELSLKYQKNTVEILSDCDAAIESVSGLINQNNRKLQAISQRVFSSVYEGKASKLSDYLIEVNDKVVPSESTPLYSLTIEDGICEKTDRYERGYLVKDTSSKTYKKVEFNDIVFNPQNVRWGAIARSKVFHPVCLSPIYEVVRVREEVAVPEFFDFLLTNQRQVAYYASKTEGSLIERMSFKIDAFMLLRFDIPTKADQLKIVSPLKVVQNEIFLLEEQLALLKKQKRGLMQQLLTGELRVKGAA